MKELATRLRHWRGSVFLIPILVVSVIVVVVGISSSNTRAAKLHIPSYAIEATTEEFDVPGDTVVLHYYGVGGWGIRWRGRYLLTAPYFSNHGLARMYDKRSPDLDAVTKGVRNTPFRDSGLILVGHGHVDHAADIPAYFAAGLPPNQAGLIANHTTLNMLAELMPPNEQFRCVEAPVGSATPIEGCGLEGFRITPLVSHHAPNVQIQARGFTIATGKVDEALDHVPDRPADYQAGETWAFLIDLLDEEGEIAFRIHYMDAVADSSQSGIPAHLIDDHKVDVHIACVPGFAYVKDYPEWVMEQGKTGFVLLGHWEDFFQPRDYRLKPVTWVLSEDKLSLFVNRIERSVAAEADDVTPLNKSSQECPKDEDRCGPRGANWAMPAPGETYQFKTNPAGISTTAKRAQLPK